MNMKKSTVQELIGKVAINKSSLTKNETISAFDTMFNGNVSEIAIGSFLTALTMKGESDDEIQGTYEALKKHERKFGPTSSRAIDVCGTGGDAIKTLNISTAAAIVTAASGCHVAKHGNRSNSGICGSADFLEAIGFDLNSSSDRLLRSLEDVGMTFLYSPNFHQSMENFSAARKSIGIRTVLNIVGPLCNPCANLSGQLIGVFKPSLLQQVSHLMENSNLTRFMVAYSEDGFDELTNMCINRVVYYCDGDMSSFTIHPKEYSLSIANRDSLAIRSKDECVRITLEGIYGYASRQIEDVIVLNAAAALLVGDRVDRLSEGIELARSNIKNGNARDTLREMINYCGDKATLLLVESKLHK